MMVVAAANQSERNTTSTTSDEASLWYESRFQSWSRCLPRGAARGE